MDIYDEGFGYWAMQQLKQRHMTQRELAKKLNISESYLSDILKGNRFAKEVRENMVTFFNEEAEESRCVVNG